MLCFFLSWTYAAPNIDEEITRARESFLHGDIESTIVITTQLLQNKKLYGTKEDITRYLLASAYTHAESHLLAAEEYQKIYWGGRALKKEALYARAQSLSEGDSHKEVLSSCNEIRSKWPNHEYADSCLLLLGKAQGHLGNISSMLFFYEQYLSKYPKSPKAESIRVQEALFEHANNQKGAKEKLRYYYFNHSYPSSAAQIRNILTQEDLLPQNLDEETQYIWSLIHSGFLEEAWQHTQVLIEKQETDPQIQKWVEENLIEISWYTRSYDTYIEKQKEEYEKSPDGLLAWKIFHAYTRSGQWKEASEWGDNMLITYKNRGRWAGAKDDVARAHMFNRNYTRAAELWSEKRSDLAKFNESFCWYMAGDYAKSITLFERQINKTDAWGVAAHYWIGRSKEKLGEDPTRYFDFVRTYDDIHWYRLLLKQREVPQTTSITIVNGQWKQKNIQQKIQHDGILRQDIIPLSSPLKNNSSIDDYSSSFQWTEKQNKPSPLIESPPIEYPSHSFSGSQLPNSYDNLPFSSHEELNNLFEQFMESKGERYPELREIYALALAGNYPVAAHKLNILYEQWKEGSISNNLVQNEMEWLPYMIFVRSHYQVMRFTILSAAEENASQSMKQINYPIVHSHYVWSLAKQYNLDPFLIHAILRAESTYREFIVSWAGAIGYVQVMPKTGAKVAHLLNEETYSPTDLENPKINLRYGSFYFSRLMERFDQSYPFAVGSYNGGPHNMSRWYKNLKGYVEMDEFVEHISFDETRRYIKKVCGYYDQYISHHTDNGWVRIPLTPGEDDASVIDF